MFRMFRIYFYSGVSDFLKNTPVIIKPQKDKYDFTATLKLPRVSYSKTPSFLPLKYFLGRFFNL